MVGCGREQDGFLCISPDRNRRSSDFIRHDQENGVFNVLKDDSVDSEVGSQH